jgi:DNA-binding transcriptional LysR family regulator
MVWVGAADMPKRSDAELNVLPLVMFDAPCVLRTAATRALDHARLPWRISLISPSVAGLWSAVTAGLGVTDLPVMLHRSTANPAPMVQQLSALLERCLEESASTFSGPVVRLLDSA